MKTIAITAATAGIKLAKDVCKADGSVLIQADNVLSAQAIELLRRLGITQLTIHADTQPAGAPMATSLTAPHEDPAAPKDDLEDAVRKIITARFGPFNPADEHVQTTFQLALEREYRSLVSKHGKVPNTANSPPAFQTQKPAPVTMVQLLKDSSNLGTLPLIFHKLVEVINSPYASAADAAKIISTDPALSAKLLRLVNSAFYGLASKVDSINRAVTLIGTGQLVMLAMGTTLVTAFKGLPVSLINMQSFWNHSLACGIGAKIIAKQANLPKADSYFVTGLLHDIGRLVFFHLLPAHSFYMITEAKRRQTSMRSMENECLGFTHEAFSAALLREWSCPEELTTPILSHHTPINAHTKPEDIALPIANFLAHALGFGSSGDPALCYVDPVAWSKIGIEATALPDLAKNIEEQVRDMHTLLSSS